MKIKKSFPDVIISVILLAFLASLMVQTPAIPTVSRGYPKGLLIIACLMTVYLLVRSLIKLKNETPQDTKIDEQAKVIFPYCLMIVAYLLLLTKIGYILSTMVFMIASFLFLKLKNKVLMIALTVITTLLLYYVFTNFLVVILPKGSIINLAF